MRCIVSVRSFVFVQCTRIRWWYQWPHFTAVFRAAILLATQNTGTFLCSAVAGTVVKVGKMSLRTWLVEVGLIREKGEDEITPDRCILENVGTFSERLMLCIQKLRTF